MTSDSTAEFFVLANAGRGVYRPTTVTVDAEGIRWTNEAGSGGVAYAEIVSIEIVVGDPDPGEINDFCTIWTATGPALRVFCASGESSRTKDRPARIEAYSSYLLFLHQQISPEDRGRIAFKTDGKLPEKAQRLIVVEMVISSIVLIGLLIAFWYPMELTFGWAFLQFVFAIVIFNMFPKEPRTYSPDPLDKRYVPRDRNA
jgi:hypothetical protein